jgi:apoptosis-inducing factor 3
MSVSGANRFPEEFSMSTAQSKPTGPDLALGIPVDDLIDGRMLLGHVGEEPVLLARRGDEFFAIGATCSHYGGPLAEGLMVEDTVRCPWHHACFSLRTGEALRAPALSPMACWRVELCDGLAIVCEKVKQIDQHGAASAGVAAGKPERIVILGGGAAGFAAAEMLRREGFIGSLTMLSADDAPPCDRPNLSKDYLAGTAPEDWLPLRPAGFYQEQDIDLQLRAEVTEIDVNAKR